jgi:hypothetical protein
LYDFESTPLWKMTLGAGGREVEPLRAAFLNARRKTSLLLGELGPSVPEYTVHDVTHADALWETASLLVGPEILVNPVEGLVLGLSFLVHDAAMGLAAYQGGPAEVLGEAGWRDLLVSVFREREGRWPSDDEVESPPAPVLADAISTAIREAHARQAARLVSTPWTDPEGVQYYLVDDAELRESYGNSIAELVESHWWNVERVSKDLHRELGSATWLLRDWPLDLLKVACLLRLADATQIDARRAPTLLMLIRRPGGESRKHWEFQRWVHRPQLRGDRLQYTSSRPFPRGQAAAWWLALDYLGSVDGELRQVDDLMHDLGRPRFAVRGVEGVGTPARFATLFQVQDWRPVDAEVRISDTRGLVAALGGEQLYGHEPHVAVRELIQNAHDAVMARRALEPGFTGSINVTLTEADDGWTLTVQDDGIGMDEDVLVRGLMDFGSSGWRTSMVRRKFSGLMSSGFRPKGRFGIGFFSVFMLGDEVEVISRRYDLGRPDARRLRFDGLTSRPLVEVVPMTERAPVGTLVAVALRTHPYEEDGLFDALIEEDLRELVERLVPDCVVGVNTAESRKKTAATGTRSTFDLAAADPHELFDRLYPEIRGNTLYEQQRLVFRDEFVRTATAVTDSTGERLGFGVVATEMTLWAPPDVRGVTIVSEFRADHHFGYSGYLLDQAGRASRDQAEPVARPDDLARWLDAQEDRLRETGRFSISRQADIGALRLRAGRALRPDHLVAVVDSGALALDQIRSWVSSRDEFVVSSGWPLMSRSGDLTGADLFHFSSGVDVALPEGWVYVLGGNIQTPFTTALPANRDPEFEWARHDDNTWQQWWWRNSRRTLGLFVAAAADSWSCAPEDLLRPMQDRYRAAPGPARRGGRHGPRDPAPAAT